MTMTMMTVPVAPTSRRAIRAHRHAARRHHRHRHPPSVTPRILGSMTMTLVTVSHGQPWLGGGSRVSRKRRAPVVLCSGVRFIPAAGRSLSRSIRINCLGSSVCNWGWFGAARRRAAKRSDATPTHSPVTATTVRTSPRMSGPLASAGVLDHSGVRVSPERTLRPWSSCQRPISMAWSIVSRLTGLRKVSSRSSPACRAT